MKAELEEMREHAHFDRGAEGHQWRREASLGLRQRGAHQPAHSLLRRAHLGPGLVHGHVGGGVDALAGQTRQDDHMHHSSALVGGVRAVR